MSQDSWTMRKGKTRISWVWNMINCHYGVRKKVRKHWKWGMKQDSVAWKFRTQKSDSNIYSDFEEKFRALSRVYFIHTIYCFEDQKVKSPTLQTVCKSNLKWRSYDHLKTTAPSWRVISKSSSKWHQFWIYPLPLWCFTSSTSGIAARALHPP